MKIYKQMWYEEEQTLQQIETSIQPQKEYIAEINHRLIRLSILCGAVIGLVVWLAWLQ